MLSFITHFSHEHSLQLTIIDDDPEKQEKCAMCNRMIVVDDDISSYYCRYDRYQIHKSCAKFPQHMNHQLHIHHRLTLVIRNNISSSAFGATTTCCYYCESPFKRDEPLYYACDECPDFFMHPACADIPLLTITTTDKDRETVQYMCHEKPMSLVVEEHDDSDGFRGEHEREKCLACRLFWSELPVYACMKQLCKNFVHRSCVDKLLGRIQHPFHPQHPLTLQVSKPRLCDSCRKNDCRLIFCCVERGCNIKINLCTKCAFLEKSIYCRSHDHSLSLVENVAIENSHGIRCDACQKDYKNCEEVIATQSFLFRCMECNFNLHFLCGPLPIILKYDYHIHPLSLVDHLVTKDDSDEYYCDVCEEEREPQCRLYYCASCKYNAHIHCMIHEIMKVIMGNTENVELCALGENRWSFGLESIEESTLRNLMDSMTEREKEILNNPFQMADWEKPLWKATYNSQKEKISHFEREGSIEDIDWIKQRFQFSFPDFYRLKRELQYFAHLGGLKVDEMYLRQKVIDVDGYLVPKTLAPILRTLLRKHGDLGGNSSSTSGIKSVAATLLCSVIDRMCRANVEDITTDVLKQWYFDLNGAIEMAGFKKVLGRDSFDELLLLALPGLKAMRSKKEIGDKLDEKIGKLQAKLKRCKENKEKLENCELETSDFMKKSLLRVVELKEKKVGDIWFPY